MPRRQTMGTWITRAQQLADLFGDDSIAPEVWKWFASMVYGELWAEVSLGALDRYFEDSFTFNADGSVSYDEPSAHMASVRVVRVELDGSETPLVELRPQDEFAYKGQVGDAIGYTLVDDQLFLYPTPPDGTYKWYFQQQPTDISGYADDEVVDVVLPAGEAFFVWGIAMLALAKQQKSVQLAMTEKEKAREQLQFQAAQRNAYEPAQKLGELDDELPVDPAERWGYR